MLKIGVLILVVMITMGFMSKLESTNKNAGSGKYYFMELSGTIKQGDKDVNAVLMTSVFYSSTTQYCSDFMKHANAHHEKFNYKDSHTCVWSYDTKKEALKSRDENIARSKKYEFKIIYASFKGY